MAKRTAKLALDVTPAGTRRVKIDIATEYDSYEGRYDHKRYTLDEDSLREELERTGLATVKTVEVEVVRDYPVDLSERETLMAEIAYLSALVPLYAIERQRTTREAIKELGDRIDDKLGLGRD